MDTPETTEVVEQVALQDTLESAYDDTQIEETTEPPETPEEILEALEAPAMWGKEYKDTFDSWGPLENGRAYQESMIKQYGETQKHVTQIEQDAAKYRKQAEDWDGVFRPYQQQMNLQGTTGPAFMRQLMGYYQQLNSNPSQTIQQLAKNYNLDLATIGQDAPYQSPGEAAQAQRISQLENAYQNSQVQARQAEINRLGKQIETFASEQDASGTPMHPHFEQVQGVMTQLMNGGAANDLGQAYDMACKLSPELVAQAQANEAAKVAARKSADAKKAIAASKRPSGQHTGGTTKKLTQKEALSAAYDKQAAM